MKKVQSHQNMVASEEIKGEENFDSDNVGVNGDGYYNQK